MKRKQALMKEWRALGITELRELVLLRERAGEATYEPDTPEHKVNAWGRTESNKTFEKWSPRYHRNIENARSGLGRPARDPGTQAHCRWTHAAELHLHEPAAVVSWILQWGPHAKVIEPTELAAMIIDELERARAQYASP